MNEFKGEIHLVNRWDLSDEKLTIKKSREEVSGFFYGLSFKLFFIHYTHFTEFVNPFGN